MPIQVIVVVVVVESQSVARFSIMRVDWSRNTLLYFLVITLHCKALNYFPTSGLQDKQGHKHISLVVADDTLRPSKSLKCHATKRLAAAKRSGYTLLIN